MPQIGRNVAACRADALYMAPPTLIHLSKAAEEADYEDVSTLMLIRSRRSCWLALKPWPMTPRT